MRDDDQRPVGIVERRDDDAAMRIGPTEINAGLMALDAQWARWALDQIRPSGATGELYLTDLVSIAVAEAQDGEPWPVTVVAGEPDDALGVNDRADLARAESRAWERKRQRLMREGVTMRLPETIVIDEDVRDWRRHGDPAAFSALRSNSHRFRLRHRTLRGDRRLPARRSRHRSLLDRRGFGDRR